MKTQTSILGEEEAYLSFTLNAFKEIVDKYGMKRVAKELDEATFNLIDEFWYDLHSSEIDGG